MGAGARPAYRHLSRNSAHRKALLRNQVQSLLKEESIRTTWEKAKETQRVVEKLITLGKKNTNGSMNAAKRHFYVRFPLIYLILIASCCYLQPGASPLLLHRMFH